VRRSTIVAGEGCELIDDQGRRYLDCIGGIAVCALGHAHPAIAQAIAAQRATLVHASNLYHHEPSEHARARAGARSGDERGVLL
jgi:acetylornithine/N-succinyldiaminopimelate aminotransferase